MNKLTRAEQKALRPAQILDAAFEEFIEQGYTAARVEDIAARVGVTKGTVYVYFPTKEILFSAMARHIAVPFEDVLADAKDLTGSYAERLRSLILLFYEHVMGDRRTRELLRFAISEGVRFPQLIDAHHVELIEPILAMTQALIDEGVRQGEFRDGSAAVARVILAPALSLIVETLMHDGRLDLETPRYIEAHLDLVMHGLAAANS
ncbi:TetR/AcrR family transcriptional regulator [Mesorhizobium waimense]|uniref:TetR/AcrR family transcriptional regulator n=1 Tax=Mesorhizobium waimense TaxID=1300307 RepID=A0A3A5KEU7_9HYPH|nr:TetR/AcrR family transcriptional regulator [Mesorhizobium waimense]RJT30914.1 TetR/AcrR family transcriptional regulator [Mesorhizobium waimense]